MYISGIRVLVTEGTSGQDGQIHWRACRPERECQVGPEWSWLQLQGRVARGAPAEDDWPEGWPEGRARLLVLKVQKVKQQFQFFLLKIDYGFLEFQVSNI